MLSTEEVAWTALSPGAVSKIASLFGGSLHAVAPAPQAGPASADMASPDACLQEAKSRFASTKSMFQSLAANGEATANGGGKGRQRPPPPLPPKPVLTPRSLYAQDSEAGQLKSAEPPPPPPLDTADEGDAEKQLPPRGDSPLTEMTKRFNDLVSDLERMNASTASVEEAPAPPPPLSQPWKGSPRPSHRYPQTISLTHALNMDAQPKAQSNSLYEPYWRNQSWMARRYGLEKGEESGKAERSAAPSNGPLQPPPEAKSRPTEASETAGGANPTTSGEKATTYGLFRTSKATRSEAAPLDAEPDGTEEGSVKSKDSGVGGSLDDPSSTARASPTLLSTERRASPRLMPEAELMTREEEAVLLSPASRHHQPEQPSSSHLLGPKPYTAAVSVPSGSPIHLPSLPALHIPQDEASKRLSQASSSVLSEEDGLSPRRYSLSKEVHWLPDGNFWLEVAGLTAADEDALPPETPRKDPAKVSFSAAPIRVYSTHSETEYDRRNADIDPVSASAEYELERRLEKMDVFDVTIHKGSEGLGFSIIGMGVGADAGLEKLGIFVKSITPGGAVAKNGAIAVCDQIVEVDGASLVGVTQAYAANILRSTQGTVTFRIGRERNLAASEIALLIRQSLEQDRQRLEGGGPIWTTQAAANSAPSSDCDSSTTPVPTTPSDAGPLPSQPDLPTPTTSANAPVLAQSEPVGYLPKEESDEETEEATPATAVEEAEQRAPTPPSSHPGSGEEERERWSGGDEDSIRAAIRRLESEMSSIRAEAREYQNLLNSSQAQVAELERKYAEARAAVSSYQTREAELLEREAAHLSQLRQKDAHYADVVQGMRSKVTRLEAALGEQAAKRTSQVEAQLSDLQAQLAREVQRKASASASASGHAPTSSTPSTPLSTLSSAPTHHSHSAHSDISPALAYQPAAKKASTHPASIHKTTVHVSNSLESSSQDAIPVPSTPLLDSSLNKSKAEAVHKSQAMAARQLPSRRAEIEVLDVCHHHDLNGHSHRIPFNPIGAERAEEEEASSNSGSGSTGPSTLPSTAQASVASPNAARRSRPLQSFFRRPHKEYGGLVGAGGMGMASEVLHALDVLHWSPDDVCGFLKALGLEKYIPEFSVNKIDGGRFLQLDGGRLKAMGVSNASDRSILKKRVKDLKSRIEKERKAIEKESRTAAKLQKRSVSNKRR